MPRVSPQLRDATVTRILAGETYSDLSAELDVPEGTLRQWVKRHRDMQHGGGPANAILDSLTGGSIVKLASDPPPIDLATLDPIALLEHDIADAREDLEGARVSKYWNAIPQLRNAVLKMQVDLDVLRNAETSTREDTDAEVAEEFTALGRVKRWVRHLKNDRQARAIVDAVWAEPEDR